MANDAELLRQFLAGSQQAFAELVQRHLGLVYSSALRRAAGDAALAHDATQAVFLLLAKKASSLRHQASVAGWLYGSAQLKVAEALRAERRRRVREHTAFLMHEISTEIPPASWEKIHAVLDDAMLALNRSDREAVLLRYIEGLPFSDIAGRLLLTESAARKRVERALERLRQHLTRKGVTSTASALAATLGTHASVAAPAGLASEITSAAALTIASVPSNALADFIAFMTTIQKTAALGVIVALLATGGALHQRIAARRLAAETTKLERQLTALRERPQPSQTPAAQGVRTGPATTSMSPSPDASTQSTIATIEAEQMRLFLAGEWEKLAGGALPLVEKLGLTADQVARYTAMAERELDGTYLPGPGAVERHRAALRDQWQRETRDLIGEGNFQRLLQLQAAKAAAEGVASYLAYWDNPLTGQQANQMLELFAANQPLIKTAEGTLPEALLGRAKQILSPEQIEFWRRYEGLADTQRQLTNKWKNEGAAASPKPSGE